VVVLSSVGVRKNRGGRRATCLLQNSKPTGMSAVYRAVSWHDTVTRLGPGVGGRKIFALSSAFENGGEFQRGIKWEDWLSVNGEKSAQGSSPKIKDSWGGEGEHGNGRKTHKLGGKGNSA